MNIGGIKPVLIMALYKASKIMEKLFGACLKCYLPSEPGVLSFLRVFILRCNSVLSVKELVSEGGNVLSSISASGARSGRLFSIWSRNILSKALSFKVVKTSSKNRKICSVLSGGVVCLCPLIIRGQFVSCLIERNFLIVDQKQLLRGPCWIIWFSFC